MACLFLICFCELDYTLSKLPPKEAVLTSFEGHILYIILGQAILQRISFLGASYAPQASQRCFRRKPRIARGALAELNSAGDLSNTPYGFSITLPSLMTARGGWWRQIAW